MICCEEERLSPLVLSTAARDFPTLTAPTVLACTPIESDERALLVLRRGKRYHFEITEEFEPFSIFTSHQLLDLGISYS